MIIILSSQGGYSLACKEWINLLTGCIYINSVVTLLRKFRPTRPVPSTNIKMTRDFITSVVWRQTTLKIKIIKKLYCTVIIFRQISWLSGSRGTRITAIKILWWLVQGPAYTEPSLPCLVASTQPFLFFSTPTTKTRPSVNSQWAAHLKWFKISSSSFSCKFEGKKPMILAILKRKQPLKGICLNQPAQHRYSWSSYKLYGYC